MREVFYVAVTPPGQEALHYISSVPAQYYADNGWKYSVLASNAEPLDREYFELARAEFAERLQWGFVATNTNPGIGTTKKLTPTEQEIVEGLKQGREIEEWFGFSWSDDGGGRKIRSESIKKLRSMRLLRSEIRRSGGLSSKTMIVADTLEQWEDRTIASRGDSICKRWMQYVNDLLRVEEYQIRATDAVLKLCHDRKALGKYLISAALDTKTLPKPIRPAGPVPKSIAAHLLSPVYDEIRPTVMNETTT